MQRAGDSFSVHREIHVAPRGSSPVPTKRDCRPIRPPRPRALLKLEQSAVKRAVEWRRAFDRLEADTALGSSRSAVMKQARQPAMVRLSFGLPDGRVPRRFSSGELVRLARAYGGVGQQQAAGLTQGVSAGSVSISPRGRA